MDVTSKGKLAEKLKHEGSKWYKIVSAPPGDQKWQGRLLGRSIRYLSSRVEPWCKVGTLEMQSRVRGEDGVFHDGESSGWIVSNPFFYVYGYALTGSDTTMIG